MTSDYRVRIISEKAGLDINRMKLKDFIGTPDFKKLTAHEKELMDKQMVAMDSYSEVLAARMEMWLF